MQHFSHILSTIQEEMTGNFENQAEITMIPEVYNTFVDEQLVSLSSIDDSMFYTCVIISVLSLSL